jgi:hypothetical protein
MRPRGQWWQNQSCLFAGALPGMAAERVSRSGPWLCSISKWGAATPPAPTWKRGVDRLLAYGVAARAGYTQHVGGPVR